VDSTTQSSIAQDVNVGQVEPVLSVIVGQLLVGETGGLVVDQQRTLVRQVARTAARQVNEENCILDDAGDVNKY